MEWAERMTGLALKAHAGRADDRARSGRPRARQGRAAAHHARRAATCRGPPTAGEVLNLCANNYLGLADHPAIVAAAQGGAGRAGASGWPRCASSAAPRTLHKELEAALGRFLGTERHHPLLLLLRRQRRALRDAARTREDAIISDELNHACIIDGIRLCKARRLRYRNRDMADLEAQLKDASGRAAFG